MKKFVLYTIGFALLAFVPTILFTVLFNSGGGDVAPFMRGGLAVGGVVAGVVCWREGLGRMEEALDTVSKTLREVQAELATVKGRQEVAAIKLDTVGEKLDMSRKAD